MFKNSSYTIRKLALEISGKSSYWASRIKETYAAAVSPDCDYIILRQLFYALSELPKPILQACKIHRYDIKDLGPSKDYYPNHGWYVDHSITLNSDIFYHPDEFQDSLGYGMSRPLQTLFHELGHSYDDMSQWPSLKEPWLKLSGWSPVYKPGLKQLVIRDKGTPEVKGEWFYDPKAEFTRFYGRRNPYDDFADCFCFYVGGLKGIVPKNKIKYLDKELSKYS